MRCVLLLSVYGLMGCSSDLGVKVFNSGPAATITSHDDGAEIKEAVEVIFRGVGSDPDHDQDELEGSWQFGADVICDWVPLDEDGVNECPVMVTKDFREITFLVRDPKDAVGSTGIFLNITDDADPHAEITSPSFDPATDEEPPFFWGDESIELVGVVSDDEDEADVLTVEWTTDTDEAFGVTPPDSSGSTRASAYLPEGIHTITLTVTDSAGNFTSDTLEIQVGPDNPAGAPDVLITFPELVLGDTAFYYGDQAIELMGLVTDDEDAADTIAIIWSSDTDGEIAVTTPDSDGTARLTADLTQGNHAITLTATDSDGHVGSDAISIEVGPNNTPPNCVLVTPTDGESGLVGTLIVFGGTVGDPDIPVDTLQVEWKNGEDIVGTSIPTTAGNVSLPLSELTLGAHVISMTVSDEMGATCTDQITFIIREPNTAPTIDIASPTSGDIATEGQPVLFDATIADAEDAPGDLTVEWASDLDGIISTRPADSSGFSRFTDTAMARGSHTITLTVTDTDGAYTTEVLVLEVVAAPIINNAPTIALLSPTDGATVEEGEPVLFNAIVNDAEDAPSALTITWTSSIDGVLTGAAPDGAGTVNFAEVGMSLGTHIIVVTVADTEGLFTSTMAVLNIETAVGEDDFLEDGDELPPELEGGTYSGCAGFDLDNLVIFGSIDAALFCACGFDEADNVKISSSGASNIDLACLDVIRGELEIDLCGANTIDLSSLASVGDGVSIHDNYDTEIIDISAMTSIGGNFNITTNVDLEDLRLASLQTVDGQLYLSSNSSLANFAVPSLTLIEGNLQFNSNSGIEEVHFDSLSTIEGQLSVEYNHGIEVLSMPSLIELDGRLYIYSNSALSNLEVGSLNEAGSSIEIRYNNSLEIVDFSQLQVINGSFLMQDAHQVDAFDLPELLEVNGSFSLSNNNQIELFTAPLFYDLSGSLTIRDNNDLTVVDLSSLACLDDFTIVGNDMVVEDLHELLLQLSCDEPGSEFVFRTADAEALCADGDMVVNDLYIYAIDPEPLDLSCIVDITGRLEIEFSDAMIVDLSRAAGVGDGINIHDNYETEEILLDSIFSTGEYFNLTGNISLEVIDLSSLSEVGGQMYLNSNSAMDMLYTPELVLIKGNLQFNSNSGLGIVDMPTLMEIEGQLSFEYSHGVRDILFPDLVELQGRLYIYSNSSLQTLDLSGLTEIRSGAEIRYNNALEDVLFTNIEVVNGSFLMQDAHQLRTLEMPKLLEVNGSFNLSNNNQIEHFGAPLFFDLTSSLTIRDNPDLQTVDLSSLACIEDFTIVGNDLTIDSHHALLLALTCSTDGSLIVFRASDADTFCDSGETIVNDLYISPIDTGVVDLSCITAINGQAEIEFAKASAIDVSNAAYIGDGLNIHDNYDTDAIDFGALVTIGGGFNLMTNRDLSVLNVDSLTHIDGQFYLNGNNNLDEISAPSLVVVEGNLQFSSNSGIEAVYLDKLTTIEGQLSLEYNHGIRVLSLPALTELDGRVYIYSNSSIETVNISSLTEVGASLEIRYSNSLENVLFSALQIVNGSFLIQDAHQVSIFDFPALIEVNGSFNLSNNNKVETFSAPLFDDLSGSLTVRDNLDLMTIILTRLTCVSDYTIVGNDMDDDDVRDLLLHIISGC